MKNEIKEKLTSHSIIVALILLASEIVKYCAIINVFQKLLLDTQVYQSIMSVITLTAFLICICYIEFVSHKNNNRVFNPNSYRNNNFFNKISKHSLIMNVIMTIILCNVVNGITYGNAIIAIFTIIIEFSRRDVLRNKQKEKNTATANNNVNNQIPIAPTTNDYQSPVSYNTIETTSAYNFSENNQNYDDSSDEIDPEASLEKAKKEDPDVYRKLLIRRGQMATPNEYIACAEDENALPYKMKQKLEREKIHYAKIINCIDRDFLNFDKLFGSDYEALQFLHNMNKSDNPVDTPSDVKYFWDNYSQYYYNHPSIADK